MIAHYRADVAELNGRARALMRADGQLGSNELSAADRTFASGDRVLVKRNDSRCDVRNGDRGVIESVDAGAGALHVRFDEKLVALDHRFLSRPTHDDRPALEHGYALTAYAAQGLTCRHALVLARDEAYSEWIYTTMTRASDANRLYVVGERGRDRDEFAPAEPARDGRLLRWARWSYTARCRSTDSSRTSATSPGRCSTGCPPGTSRSTTPAS